MITEDYCSYEIVKLLKEKGFDEHCDNYYDQSSDEPQQLTLDEMYYSYDEFIKAPTLQMAMKWLRKTHHIHIEICLYKTNEDDIEPKKSRKAPYYIFEVWDTVTGNNVDKRLTNDFIGDTYEQACEASIKYCLENLI